MSLEILIVGNTDTKKNGMIYDIITSSKIFKHFYNKMYEAVADNLKKMIAKAPTFYQ